MDAIDIAVQQTALEAPGGAKRLAQVMGLRYQTLINKCNPHDETHKLTLREALAMMLVTGDTRIIEAMAAELGGTFQSNGPRPGRDLLSALLNADAEHGDVGRAIRDAFADGQLTARELAEIQREVSEAKRALDELLGSVVALRPEEPA